MTGVMQGRQSSRKKAEEEPSPFDHIQNGIEPVEVIALFWTRRFHSRRDPTGLHERVIDAIFKPFISYFNMAF